MADVEARLREQLADRYVMQRELGRGGMSIVYLAEDRKHGRPVAIKVLRPELAAAIGAERFLHEIEVAARLQHPHILPLYDSGRTGARADGQPTGEILYYVMPYVEGESLRDRLTREKQLPVADAVQIARETADALSFAHSHGVVHRDIKPENILFMGGHAVVADFGIARALDVAGGRRLTGTGMVLGTPTYMSPEQAGGGDVDGRSDVYALGCVLYEMLAGSPPFTAPSVDAVLAQHVTQDPPVVTAIRPTVPAPVANALRRALAKTPADRFATAHQFAQALAAVRLSAPAMSPAVPSAARPRAGRWIGLAAAAVLVVAAAWLGWSWWRPPPGAVTPSAEAIAVLPFVPASGDTALQRLGRELAVTLGASLDGVGAVRTVDPFTVLAQTAEQGDGAADAGVALARRLGARAVLRGTLVHVRDAVRLDAVLSDVAAGTVLARASVTGPPENLLALTDSAALAILEQIWRRGDPPAPSLAAITTHSVAALRAYIEGEQALAHADFDVAVRAFERAFAEDSTFWFAYWRSLYPRVYEGSRPDSAVMAAIIAHYPEFPPADRLLVESALADSLDRQVEILREATRRYPTYWPAWYSLANTLVHDAPMLGTTFEDARAALERVLDLNPRFFPARDHLFWYGPYLRDSALAERTWNALERLAGEGSFRMNPDRVSYYRAALDLVRQDGRFTAAQLDANADFLVGASRVSPRYLGYGLLDFRFPQAQVALNDLVLARQPRRELAAALWLGTSLSQATRGAWDDALAALRTWLQVTDEPEAALTAYGIAVTGAHLGPVAPEAARAFRPAGTADAGSPDARAELAWLDGMLAHARGDRDGLAAARRAVRAAGSTFGGMLDRSLGGFALMLDGREADGARQIAALEWDSAELQRYHGYGARHPWLTSVNRLAAARGVLAAGDTAEAARLLTWTDAVLWNVHGLMDPVLAVFEPLALFERARIAEAQGRAREAASLYQRFLARYDRPEGPWTARVEEALGAVRR